VQISNFCLKCPQCFSKCPKEAFASAVEQKRRSFWWKNKGIESSEQDKAVRLCVCMCNFLLLGLQLSKFHTQWATAVVLHFTSAPPNYPYSQKKRKKLNQAKPNQTRPHSRLGSADFRCPTTGSILAPYSKNQGTSASDPGFQGRTEDEGKAAAKP